MYPVDGVPVVRSQRVQINATERNVYRMNDEDIRRQTAPHKLPNNRAALVDLEAGTGGEIAACAGILRRRIQGRRYAAAHIECDISVLCA